MVYIKYELCRSRNTLVNLKSVKRRYKPLFFNKTLRGGNMKKYTKKQIIKYLQDKIDNKEITSTLFFAKKENISLETVFKRLGVNSWKEVLILIDRKNAKKR